MKWCARIEPADDVHAESEWSERVRDWEGAASASATVAPARHVDAAPAAPGAPDARRRGHLHTQQGTARVRKVRLPWFYLNIKIMISGRPAGQTHSGTSNELQK